MCWFSSRGFRFLETGALAGTGARLLKHMHVRKTKTLVFAKVTLVGFPKKNTPLRRVGFCKVDDPQPNKRQVFHYGIFARMGWWGKGQPELV